MGLAKISEIQRKRKQTSKGILAPDFGLDLVLDLDLGLGLDLGVGDPES